jgi:hypothetical protein
MKTFGGSASKLGLQMTSSISFDGIPAECFPFVKNTFFDEHADVFAAVSRTKKNRSLSDDSRLNWPVFSATDACGREPRKFCGIKGGSNVEVSEGSTVVAEELQDARFELSAATCDAQAEAWGQQQGGRDGTNGASDVEGSTAAAGDADSESWFLLSDSPLSETPPSPDALVSAAENIEISDGTSRPAHSRDLGFNARPMACDL